MSKTKPKAKESAEKQKANGKPKEGSKNNPVGPDGLTKKQRKIKQEKEARTKAMITKILLVVISFLAGMFTPPAISYFSVKSEIAVKTDIAKYVMIHSIYFVFDPSTYPNPIPIIANKVS